MAERLRRQDDDRSARSSQSPLRIIQNWKRQPRCKRRADDPPQPVLTPVSTIQSARHAESRPTRYIEIVRILQAVREAKGERRPNSSEISEGQDGEEGREHCLRRP
jgi:hypothetical protein